MIQRIKRWSLTLQSWLNYTNSVNFIALLAIRLYLAPIYWMAGTRKWQHMDNTIAWFGNTEWGLGLPWPILMAYLATLTEIVGAVFLLFGLAMRFISIPLLMVMAVAAFGVHWEAGWDVIAEQGSEAASRLGQFLEWVKHDHPARYQHITELGRPVILNNGIEFAVTYSIMLLVLFFYGAGKYLSVDYWYDRYLHKDNTPSIHDNFSNDYMEG